MMDVPALLLTGLEELTEEQLKTFQFYLTSVQLLGFPPIPERQLENTDRQVTVDQIVKRYDPEGAVRITLKILKGMNLDDLAEKLERDYIRGNITIMYINLYITITVQCRSNQKEHSTDFIITFILLLTKQLKTFQFYLTSVQLLGFPPIPERQLENTDRQVTVDQIVKRYDPEGAVRITLKILKGMNLDDLAEKLERDYIRENVSNVPSNKRQHDLNE
uniref:Pyrin domain-containing protein n=1 Tax=Oncorhynchus tshawytscha TaxID=74940 RepID=A0AAZ3NYN5_ONCTS